LTRRRALLLVVCTALLGAGGGGAVAALRAPAHAHVALPALHGQATWAPGARPAPTAGLRGHTSVVTFMDPRCTSECPVEGRQLASVLRRLPAASRPTIVMVSVNPAATRRDAARATAKWGLAPFRTRWILGARTELAPVWRAYRVAVKPVKGDIEHTLVLYLLDRRGDERTAYLFPFLPSFLQRDLATLARERA
jgi:cytochrome oxidase Cu insertion factor (SCO1/SenC/PrrC family)